MHSWLIYLPLGNNSYNNGSSSFIFILSLKSYLKSHFLSEKDINPTLGEYGSMRFFLFHEIFINAPGLISFIFSTSAKSPLRLFLMMRLKFSLSQMKFVYIVINIEVKSEKIFLIQTFNNKIILTSFNYRNSSSYLIYQKFI